MPSFLIWFWKCSTRGYVRHIHSPLTPTNLFVRWHSVCTTHFMLRRGYLKLLKEEESFDFMAGKKPQIWKLHCILDETTVETRCHLKNHLC